MEEMGKYYQIAFDIILAAGDARSTANEAMDKAEANDFENADKLLAEAKEKLVDCHNIQTGLLNEAADNVEIDVNIFLVHAQDHFSMASTSIEISERFINLYKRLNKMEVENE